MNCISPIDVAADRESFELIDIREAYEFDAVNIGGRHIPMAEVISRCAELRSSENILLMCRSGKRAEALANMLEKEYGFDSVYIMEGGLQAWATLVDSNLIID